VEKNNSFLNELSNKTHTKLYQGFICELGIDHVPVLIPLKHLALFEKMAKEKSPSTRKQLKQITDQFEGLFDVGVND
jgi:hypothetical protein